MKRHPAGAQLVKQPEIKISTTKAGLVLLDTGRKVRTLIMTRAQAIAVATILLKHAGVKVD